MVSLFLAIICSVSLGFIFKLFERFRISAFQAIAINYLTCVLCGWLHAGVLPFAIGEPSAPWLPYALALGGVFIAGFQTAALTVQYFGVTISQVMQKMSLLLTVPFAIGVYGETSNPAKWMGFVFALSAIILVNWRQKGLVAPTFASWETGMFWIPLLTWLLSGIIEITLIVVRREQLADFKSPAFITTVFCTAGLIGAFLTVVGLTQQRLQFSWRNVLGGIGLGIPNYASMWFLFQALDSGLEASVVFPLLNIGVILVATFGAMWLFKERLLTLQRWGIVLAIASIGLISTGCHGRKGTARTGRGSDLSPLQRHVVFASLRLNLSVFGANGELPLHSCNDAGAASKGAMAFYCKYYSSARKQLHVNPG